MKKIIIYLLLIFTFLNSSGVVYSQTSDITDSETNSSESANLEELLDVSPSPQPFDLLINDVSGSSAFLKAAVKFRKLTKQVFRAEESVTLVVDNASVQNIKVKVFDFNGNEVGVETEIVNNENPVILKANPSIQFQPGRYRVKVESAGETFTQEFTWGVLAINTNKSIYAPHETASISMAVLDDTGEMVCNSEMTLEITPPEGETTTLTTEDGTIIVNPECYTKDFTMVPDYQASYNIGVEGIYSIKLTATTPDGQQTVKDSFEVNDSVDFDIERHAPTRIYPPLTYPVTLKVTANKDFEGVITDTVPGSFTVSQIRPPEEYGLKDSVTPYDSLTLQNSDVSPDVLGAEIFNIGKPFEGDYGMTLGFGGQHRDPNVGKKYTDFGVLGHDGVDFALPKNTPVIAVDDGEVVRAGDGDYGVTIVIQHEWGRSYYGHLDKIIKPIGEKVKKGQVIALSGDTGLSSGPHLHFGIKPTKNDFENGFYGKVNPLPFMGITDNGVQHGMVAGVATSAQQQSSDGVQKISWNVKLKKGDAITLGYQFNAPQISPELYLLGKLELREDGKKVFSETRHWQIAADSVVQSGGIVSSEAQFGGLQRKVAYVNSNWYAFYTDGTDVFWKKSSDGITWGSANNLDSAEDNDADNYNPSIDVSGNFIHVAYLDDSADQVQILTLDTSSDTTSQTTSPCTLTSPGAFAVSTYMVSIASLSDTAAVVAYSDTNGGANVDIFEVAALTSASCTSTDVHPGNIAFGTQGSGITASDRPVLVGLDSTSVMMIFTDGSNLNSAKYDATRDEWRRNDQVIAAIADSTYSVVTDGTDDVWVLTQNGTTATRLYHLPVASTGINETLLDSDIGSSGDEQDTELDIWCPPTDPADCKIIYVDNLETNGPDLVFVDCDNEACSVNTKTVIDSDTGSATNAPSPSISCVSVTDCKIAHGDVLGGTSPDMSVWDCNDATCSAPSQGDIDADLGDSGSKPAPAIWCPFGGDTTDCKVIYFEDATDDLFFADCSAANCSTRNTLTAIALNIDVVSNDSNVRMSLDCLSVTDCRVLYHDNDAGDLSYIDCANAGCTSPSITDIDIDVGIGNTINVPNAIDCGSDGTDCKIIYADASQNEFNFVDCASAACATSPVITKIDDTAGGIETHGVDLDCPSVTNCKGVYVGNTTGGSEDQYFFDCDSASCTSGSVVDLDNPPTRSGLSCPSSANCKLVYYDAVESGQPPFYFADCTNEKCLPDWESLTAPWTSESNVLSVSLTYDSSNTDLIASIIKDTPTETAYYRVSDAATISWGTSTAYDGFSGTGDMDNISTPETAAGTGQMGALLREGSNIEFDLFAALITGPTLDQLMRHGAWFSGGAEQPFTF